MVHFVEKAPIENPFEEDFPPIEISQIFSQLIQEILFLFLIFIIISNNNFGNSTKKSLKYNS
jgi:hypothetical protein